MQLVGQYPIQAHHPVFVLHLTGMKCRIKQLDGMQLLSTEVVLYLGGFKYMCVHSFQMCCPLWVKF